MGRGRRRKEVLEREAGEATKEKEGEGGEKEKSSATSNFPLFSAR